MSQKIVIAALLGGSMLSLSAGNTIEGAGEDIKALGETMQSEASKSKTY